MKSCIDLPNQPGFESIYAPHLQNAVNRGLNEADEKTEEAAVRDMNSILSNMRKAGADVEDGATFNMDGSEYDGGGIALPIISTNQPVNLLNPTKVNSFINRHKDKKGNIKVGVFKFKRESKTQFKQADKSSMDLNIIIQPWQKNLGLITAKVLRQNSLFDLDAFESFYTGETGNNPLRISNKQFALIQEHLDKGTLPPFVVDKYNKLGGPFINNKGETILTHWSNQSVEDLIKSGGKINPAFHGTGKRGSDWRNKGNFSKQWVDFTSYGINVGKKGGYKKEPGIGNTKYEVSIEATELYDFDSDPAGLLDIAKEVVTKEGMYPSVAKEYTNQVYIKLISDAGFSGLWSKKGPNGITASVFKGLKPDTFEEEKVVEPVKPKVKPIVPIVKPIVPIVKPIVPIVKPIVPTVKPIVPVTGAIVTGASPIYDKLLNKFTNDKAKQIINKLDKPLIITTEGNRGYHQSYSDKVTVPLDNRDGVYIDLDAVVLHEYGHHIDFMLKQIELGYNPYHRYSPSRAYKISHLSADRFKSTLVNDAKKLGLIFRGSVTTPTPKEARSKLLVNSKESNSELVKNHIIREEFLLKVSKQLEFLAGPKGNGMIHNILDIIDGTTGGEFSNRYGLYGHPRGYWKKSKNNKFSEAFANLFSLWAYTDKQYWILAKDLFPETTNEFEVMMEEVLND